MTKLKLHYDGWLALPATIRRRMGITTGDQLQAEWTDQGLLIKSPNAGSASASEETEIEPAPSPKAKAKPEAKTAPKPEPEPTPVAPAFEQAPKKAIKTAKKPAAKTAKPTATKSKPTNKLAASTIPRTRGRRKTATD